ncbi:MAG: glycosyl transferase [Gammaproteobacteria bacterium]|nr:glycosyl transferase [Gammaproteobacteria bacterium]
MRLVYLSPVPWTSFAQRPHKFVEWFHARSGGDVLWVDPYPTRLMVLEDLQRWKAGGGSATKQSANRVPAWITILQPRSLPIEPLPGAGMINRLLWKDVLQGIDRFVAEGECLLGIGKPSELALQVLDRHAAVTSLYDAMDDFPAFYRGISRGAMAHREAAIATRVNRILVSSSMLADRFTRCRTKLAVARNACSADTLPPFNAVRRTLGRPVLGYVGTMGHWFDWRLLFALAEVDPSLCIRLIGPAYVLPNEPVPANIEFLPACDHEAAIRAMQEFSVGLIPFKCTDLTASVDPIKYYEYRALGLPVLSSRFGEMNLRDGHAGVFLVEKQDDLANLLRTAMAYQCEREEIQEFRTANTWEARFDASGILH